MTQWWGLMEEIGARRDKSMKPQVVAWELGKRLSSDAIVSADSRLDQALAATGPVIVEAVVDPFTPPAPAKITRVLLAEVIDIDVGGRRALLRDGSMEYDILIVATGSRHHYFGNDDWEKIAPATGSATGSDTTFMTIFL
jgi:NADPH-dependent 2,4-dienoyl-CoA reductase/sulfur reductase-like enzyme